jgi:hypothetical protein
MTASAAGDVDVATSTKQLGMTPASIGILLSVFGSYCML